MLAGIHPQKSRHPLLGGGVVFGRDLLALAAVLGAGLGRGLAAGTAVGTLFSGLGGDGQCGHGGDGDEGEDGFHSVGCVCLF